MFVWRDETCTHLHQKWTCSHSSSAVLPVSTRFCRRAETGSVFYFRFTAPSCSNTFTRSGGAILNPTRGLSLVSAAQMFGSSSVVSLWICFNHNSLSRGRRPEWQRDDFPRNCHKIRWKEKWKQTSTFCGPLVFLLRFPSRRLQSVRETSCYWNRKRPEHILYSSTNTCVIKVQLQTHIKVRNYAIGNVVKV